MILAGKQLMMNMEKFICDLGGKKHHLHYSKSILEPDLIYNMSEMEKQERVINEGIFYLIDKAVILTKGNLFIHIKETDKYMHWETWVKIEKKEFDKLTKNTKPILEGELFSQITYYRNSSGARVKLIFDLLDSEEQYPQIEMINNQREIEKDYLNGVAFDKVLNWMKSIYHSD